ncbi:MAG: LysR family transcriptional regulator [Roseateles sp.]|uniref:LysR family transcriptional regulator n=1 Tax=Roseateles sp. TaxID=1971397 RepID=UPI00403743C2
MDTLEAMRAFVKVAESGSFTEAARRLDVAKPLVTRAVQALEARIGTRLFHRTTRRVSLTDAGQRYLGKAAPALVEFDELEASLRGEAHGEVSGTLRLTMPVSLGVRYLVPLLAEFKARHPRLRLDLDFCDHLVDPVARGFDAAVRVSTRLEDSALTIRRIAASPVVLAAAPAYLARAGVPDTLEGLRDHQMLEVIAERAATGVPRVLAGDAALGAPIRANSVEALKGFAVAGHGVIRAPAFALAEELASGSLVRLLSDAALGEYVVSLVFANRTMMPLRLRRLIDHLALGMQDFAEVVVAPRARSA